MANAKYPASTTTGWVEKRYLDWGDGHHGDHVGVTPVSATGTPLAAMPVEGVAGGVAVATSVSAITLPTAIYAGQKAVAAAGTDEALAASQALASGVTVKALAANTGNVYVGPEGVAAATGYVLAAGESVFIEVDDLAAVWLDAAVNGEGVSYIAS